MNEPFAQVKYKFLRGSSLSRQAKLVGVVMATCVNSERLAWPGMERLMRDTGYGRHVVERARAELVRGGFLEKMYHRRSGIGAFAGVRFRVTAKILHPPFPPNQGKR